MKRVIHKLQRKKKYEEKIISDFIWINRWLKMEILNSTAKSSFLLWRIWFLVCDLGF